MAVAIRYRSTGIADGVQRPVGSGGMVQILPKWRVLKAGGDHVGEEVWQQGDGLADIVYGQSQHPALRGDIGWSSCGNLRSRRITKL